MTPRPGARVGLILLGYAAAILVALLAVRIYIGLTSGPARDASAGMFAFGDMLAFLAVFALAAVPPTVAVLFLLRSRPGFWMPLAIAALILAATSVAALLIHLGETFPGPGAPQRAWPAYATLRLLLAPLCALAFLLAGILAPVRRARLALLAAAAVEIAVLGVVALTWARPWT